MGVACEVYTKLLFKRGHGHPLWEPEPTQSGEVLVGDVGYMLDGGFYRLFNVTLPADHPLNKRHGVPDGYEPLTLPDTLRHYRPHALQAGPICSKSVTAVSADASVEAGTGPIGPLAHIRFKFSDEQGAVLVLKNDAHREDLHPCRDLTQYILLNHAGWHQFARNVCRLDLKSQDIIFVSGCVKTAEWALAAATDRARDGEIAFGGDFGPAGQASFSVSATREVSMSWEHRRDPHGTQGEGSKPSKFDQCVFLHYYKVKHRPFFVPKVLRAATEEEHSSRSSTPNGSDYMEPVDDGGAISKDASFESENGGVEVIPRPSEQPDVVDTMLDYILEQTDATCAIVSDRDITMLSSQQGHVDIPENLSQFLSDSHPTLTVTEGVGMLPCHNALIDGTILARNAPLALPPMVQFVAGPPRVLPYYRAAWSGSAGRKRRSRSRAQSITRALSSSSALAKPDAPQLSQSPLVPTQQQAEFQLDDEFDPCSFSISDWSSYLMDPAWARLHESSPSSACCLDPLSGPALTGEDDDLFALEEDEFSWQQQPEGSSGAPVREPSAPVPTEGAGGQLSVDLPPVEDPSSPADHRHSLPGMTSFKMETTQKRRKRFRSALSDEPEDSEEEDEQPAKRARQDSD
uniref:N/A n=1 Tax=Ganoderma boninense TaxID=34458 RepID=A0A5K1JX94_9APHY|nr:N/A [Ganoderma boninense]